MEAASQVITEAPPSPRLRRSEAVEICMEPRDMAAGGPSHRDEGALLAEMHGQPIPDLHLRLWDMLEGAANVYPGHDALVSLWQPQDLISGTLEASSSSEASSSPSPNPPQQQPLRWSYADLLAKSSLLASSLRILGLRRGMRLGVALPNSAEWALFFWAAARLEVAFCPVDATVAKDAGATLTALQPHLVVVQDAAAAVALDEADQVALQGPALQGPGVRLHCTGEHVQGWLRLCDVPTHGPLEDDQDSGARDDDTALVVFTSGTTGEAKGCVHTHRNLVSELCDFDPEPSPGSFLRFLVHTPSSHIFAVNNCLRAWRWGGTAIFPSRSFDVDATLRALVRERCSVMSATPTLVRALVAHPAFPSRQELDLQIVTIGGTAIAREDIDLCREGGLGAQVAIQVYGMSEGAPLITFARTDPDYADGYHEGVGKVLPGARARVCRSGSRSVLRRGEVGELHVGGTSVITRYLNRETDESMYEDHVGNWLVTGDQAKMDAQGIVYLLGRYKDLIIRGGENIHPVKIESVLQEIPGVQAQVVGVSDELAGQVPVAVVAMLPETTTKAQLVQKSRSLDPRHALDAVYTLPELGLDAFPVTSLGKVKKALLREKIQLLRQPEPEPEPQPEPDHNTTQPGQKYTSRLLDVWEKLCGTRPNPSDSVLFLADSITLLRYCDHVLRACGQRLYLQDFADHETVEKQARLLLSREIQQASLLLSQGPPSRGFALNPPSLPSLPNHQAHAPLDVDERCIWKAAQDKVVSVGLPAAAVEDVMVIRHSLRRTAMGSRPQSYHNRMVFRVRDTPNDKILGGLEKALTSCPMLRTVVFQAADSVPHHAVLSPSPALFHNLIHPVRVATEPEAHQLAKDDSPAGHSSPFMFQCSLVDITSSSSSPDQHPSSFLIFTFNHSVIDALSLTQWHHALDGFIQDANLSLPALTPYRLFADLFSQYEDSEPAQRSVAFHVKRLRGISRFGRRALWPPQRAPGMLISNDAGSPHFAERARVRRRVWGGDDGQWEHRAAEFQYPRSGRVVALPGLALLRDRHGIPPSLLAKSAVALFNVLQTGSSHALFNSWESGRSWPFVPPWMASLLPPAMSIDGPTVQWQLNMPEVVPDETALAFLTRMALEQDQMKTYEHVPWNRVVQGLRDEGPMAEAASFRQSFVWDVSMAMTLAKGGDASDFNVLEPVTRYDWPDCGLFWNAFMIDSVNMYFIASWDTAQMNDTEVDAHCDGLAHVLRKLTDENNWDKKVGDVFTPDALR